MGVEGDGRQGQAVVGSSDQGELSVRLGCGENEKGVGGVGMLPSDALGELYLTRNSGRLPDL